MCPRRPCLPCLLPTRSSPSACSPAPATHNTLADAHGRLSLAQKCRLWTSLALPAAFYQAAALLPSTGPSTHPSVSVPMLRLLGNVHIPQALVLSELPLSVHPLASSSTCQCRGHDVSIWSTPCGMSVLSRS